MDSYSVRAAAHRCRYKLPCRTMPWVLPSRRHSVLNPIGTLLSCWELRRRKGVYDTLGKACREVNNWFTRRPTPTRFLINMLYTQLENTSLQSIPTASHPWDCVRTCLSVRWLRHKCRPLCYQYGWKSEIGACRTKTATLGKLYKAVVSTPCWWKTSKSR